MISSHQYKKYKRKRYKEERLGPTQQKILLLLATGLSLSLTRRPDYYFRILKSAKKEWQRINQRSLQEAIRKLYQSKMIDYKENDNGTVTLTLAEKGKKRVLVYNLEKMKIKRPKKWDGLWRIVMFDIPEYKKRGRDALALKMKELGLVPLQKSVFVYPYDCKDEVDFISEIFEVKPYVRYVIAKDIDVALDLKNKFRLM